MYLLKFIFILFIIINIFGCTEKTTYSGKIINSDTLTNIKVLNRKDLLEKFGPPSYVDNLQNKYFYYTEMNKSINFYKENKEFSYLFIFDLDKDDNIIKRRTIDLLNQQDVKFIKKETSNEIIERGLIEKIFGGVGPNQLPNSP